MKTEETNFTDADAATRCCLYLLGEGTDGDRESFEQLLATEPGLADELIRQADLVLAIAESQAVRTSKPLMPERQRSLAAIALAIATCLALVIFGWNLRDNDSAEELLIARAWADNIADGASDPAGNQADADVESVGVNEVDLNEDASFDWMFAAVAMDSDAIESDPTKANSSQTEMSNEG